MMYGSLLQTIPKRFLLIPLVAVLLFVASMTVFWLILRDSEVQTHRSNMERNAELIAKIANEKLLKNHQFLLTLAESVGKDISEPDLIIQASQHLSSNLDLLAIAYISNEGKVQWVVPSTANPYIPSRPAPEITLATQNEVKEKFLPVYSQVFNSPYHDDYLFEVHVPVIRNGQLVGTVMGSYQFQRFLRVLTPDTFRKLYGVAFYNLQGQELGSTVPLTVWDGQEKSRRFALGAPANNLTFEIFSVQQADQVVRDMLLILVIGLSVLVVFSMGGLLQHMYLRLKAEQVRDQFFNLSLDIFCIVNPDGQFHMVNPAFTQLFGQDVLEKKRTLFDVLRPQDQPRVKADFDRLASGKVSTVMFENRCRCENNVERWIEWTMHADPNRRFYYVAAHDITMRKNRELDLQADHTFQKVIENSMITGVRVVDLEGKIIYVNPAFCRMTGFSEESMMNQKPPFPYWHENEHYWTFDLFDRILSGDVSMSGIERRFRRADGSDLYAKLYMSPVIANDRVTGWMTAFIDITERKKAQKVIEETYEQFMRVFDSLDLAVSVCAKNEAGELELLFANEFYENIFGKTEDGHRRLITRVAETYDVDTTKPIGSANALPVAADRSSPFEGVIYCEPKKKWFDVRIRQIRWIDDRVVQLQHATDITERKLTEEMHDRQQEKLQFNGRLVAMGEMASSLAHELNQPLTAIVNYTKGSIARLSQHQISFEELLVAMEKTAHQAERAGQIIKRMRNFVQKSAPKQECLSLIGPIENAIGFAEIEARKDGLKIHRDFAGPIPPVLADAILIEQVIFNLLRNAIDSMKDCDRPTIKIGVREIEDAIEVSIHDEGHGIPEESGEDIYMAFYTTKTEGMGMGLNICRSIIEVHGGRIWNEPNGEKGTIFRFTLPIYKGK